MAARWLGQNSGPIFAVCRPKYTELSLPVRSLQRRVPIDDILLRSGDIRYHVAKLSEIARNFDVLGPPNFGGRGHPNFRPNFINLGRRRTCGKVW